MMIVLLQPHQSSNSLLKPVYYYGWNLHPVHDQCSLKCECRMCRSLTLVMHGSSESSCERCDQVDDLLSLVANLQEEAERLKSIREFEKEVDQWKHPLLFQTQEQPPEKNKIKGILYPPPARQKAVA